MSGDEARERWPASIGNDPEPAPMEPPPDPSVRVTGPPASPAALAESGRWRHKSVLLVDSNKRTRESRAKIMRTLGVRVDCAANATTARVRLASETYNLVLVDPGSDAEAAETFVKGVKTNNARQLVGFLVGSPLFVAQSLRGGDSRPRRAAELAPAPSPASPNPPAAGGFDFGQRIRDAEEKQETA
jgi:hypothetical protein